MGEITTILNINKECDDDGKLFIIDIQIASGSRIIRNDHFVTDALGISSRDSIDCIWNRILTADGYQVGDRKKPESVYIVKRKYGDKVIDFVFRHKKDAEKCFKRLKENNPDEEFTLEKNVIREDYA